VRRVGEAGVVRAKRGGDTPATNDGLAEANVRLRAEVAELRRELAGARRSLSEAAEQQTATAEVLRVIS